VTLMPCHVLLPHADHPGQQGPHILPCKRPAPGRCPCPLLAPLQQRVLCVLLPCCTLPNEETGYLLQLKTPLASLGHRAKCLKPLDVLIKLACSVQMGASLQTSHLRAGWAPLLSSHLGYSAQAPCSRSSACSKMGCAGRVAVLRSV
jgi:hypothetical protein